jgi:hypothetical protein
MRRLLAAKLLFALLSPWFLTQGAGLRAVVPCPMHSGHTLANHSPSRAPDASDQGMSGHGDDTSHHSTTAKGCNCAGDCGRTVTHIAFPTEQTARTPIFRSPRIDTLRDQNSLPTAAYSVPFATGPPERLLS